jgi:hypothetical protein
MHIRTAAAEAPTRLRHHDVRTYTLRTPPHPHMGQCTKIPHRIPPKENKPRRIRTIRLEHPRPRPRDGPTLQTYARRYCPPHETSTHSGGSARPSQPQQLQQRDMQQLQQRHLHLPDLPLHSRMRDMRGTSSSHTV